jgi:hypothetical protein
MIRDIGTLQQSRLVDTRGSESGSCVCNDLPNRNRQAPAPQTFSEQLTETA